MTTPTVLPLDPLTLEACAKLVDSFYVEWPNSPTIAARIRALAPRGTAARINDTSKRAKTIRNTSPLQPTVDPASVAAALGAEPTPRGTEPGPAKCRTCGGKRFFKGQLGALEPCPTCGGAAPSLGVRPAREVAHEHIGCPYGTQIFLNTATGEYEGIHSEKCDKLTSAIERDRADTARELETAVGLLRLVTTQCPNCDENRRVECSDECVSIPANIMKSLAWLAAYDERRRKI